MHILEQLGLALGLASLAGVNLYLTVFLTGLLVRFDLLHLADKYQTLDALGHPAVLGVAGVLFALEFFADKIPWVDSLWDSVHTIIRPVGGTMLALQALGDMPPHLQVMAGLLAGGAALTTHSAKAGTRLLINHSPEPFSNVAMSLAEDAAVGAGAFLVLLKPVIAFAVFGVLLLVLWVLLPRIWGIIRSSAWFIWMKLRVPGKRQNLDTPAELPREIDGNLLTLLAARKSISDRDILWTARCVSGKCKGVKGLRPNLKAMLVGQKEGPPLLVAFRRGFKDVVLDLPAKGTQVGVDSKFLSENLQLSREGMSITLRFPRGEAMIVETLAMHLGGRSPRGGASEPAAAEVAADSDRHDLTPVAQPV